MKIYILLLSILFSRSSACSAIDIVVKLSQTQCRTCVKDLEILKEIPEYINKKILFNSSAKDNYLYVEKLKELNLLNTEIYYSDSLYHKFKSSDETQLILLNNGQIVYETPASKADISEILSKVKSLKSTEIKTSP